MYKSLIFILYMLQMCSCATNVVTMTVTEPAPVTLPGDIKSVGIINRSLVSDENKLLNKVDEILSIEGNKLDSVGSVSCMKGVFDELIQKNRFEFIKIIDCADLRSPVLLGLPSLLDWETVDKICRDQKVDILFVLEQYDTDTKISYKINQVTIKTAIGLNIPGIEHEATVSTVISTTWRIYDPLTKKIYDEFPGSRRFISRGKGINPAKAIQAISSRKDLLKQNSNTIGHIYARRILPYRRRVSRDYFVNGSSGLRTGKRKAQTGNWDGAAEKWLKETKSTKRKVAGRGCYNMAISNEINGDTDKAIDWAQKSYEDYNNKLALDYVKILRKRKARIKLLQVQRGE
jgi:hypothetical protein